MIHCYPSILLIQIIRQLVLRTLPTCFACQFSTILSPRQFLHSVISSHNKCTSHYAIIFKSTTYTYCRYLKIILYCSVFFLYFEYFNWRSSYSLYQTYNNDRNIEEYVSGNIFMAKLSYQISCPFRIVKCTDRGMYIVRKLY